MQTCSHQMTATSVTHTVSPDQRSLRAATRIQPISGCLSQQLLHPFRPASTQLQRLCSCLPVRASQATPASTIVTAAADEASKASNGNASRVKAAFAEAGLSQDAIGHILKQYPAYLRWDLEQKLLPALRPWQQELGDSFMSEFQRYPFLLNRNPEEEQLKDQYLASIGIRSPEVLRKRNPYVFGSLTSMQSKVASLQQHGFTRVQTLSLIEQHSNLLRCSFEHIDELLGVIGDMFGCADSGSLCDVILSCRRVGVFTMSPTILRHNFTYFCTCIGMNEKEMQRAWKHGVFTAPPAEVDMRLHSITARLDTTLDEAKAVVRSMPQILMLLPETVGLHVTHLLDLGFSHGQVRSMCLQQPFMLTCNFSSDVHVAKWGFLTCVLRLSHDVIAAHSSLLKASLPNRLGPRWEYLQQLRLRGLIAFTAAPQVLNSLVFMTDSKFRAAYTTPQLPLYDEHFQKQWQQKWDSLLVDQQLTFQDIGDNPALLHISLKDT